MEKDKELLQMRIEAENHRHALELEERRAERLMEREERAAEFRQEMNYQQEQLKLQLTFTHQMLSTAFATFAQQSNPATSPGKAKPAQATADVTLQSIDPQ